MLRHIIRIIACILTALWLAAGQTYLLEMVQNPDDCRGGEICELQPSVQVINKATLQIEYSFQGDVYTQLSSTPTGYESLYIGKSCDLDGCGQKVVDSLAKATFVNGLAKFEDLVLTASGSYTMQFIGRKPNGAAFADVFSQPFIVTVGMPYKLAFTNFVGTAFGGTVFAESPSVAVVDRGGNTVSLATAYADPSDVDSDEIIAVLTHCPFPSIQASTTDLHALLQPALNTRARIVDGVATFEGLYLNRTGYPYQITFYSGLSVLASSELASEPFDVVTGAPAKLAFEVGYELHFTPKYAGEFFLVPPRLRLLDVGGNFVSTDNSSALLVAVRHNPTGRALVGPPQSLFVVAYQGLVSFNSLSIDTQGHNYTLIFTLFTYSILEQRHIQTDVSLTSEKFEVGYGPARKLVIKPGFEAGGAWAGNQAFIRQPVLELQDFGGNARYPDFTSTVTASIVPSLSVGFDDVLIDTTDAPQTVVQNVTIELEDGTYGAGHVVDISLAFAVNVWIADLNSTLLDSTPASREPYLVLNVVNAALNTPARATLTGVSRQSKVLTFRYVVRPGDSTQGNPLDFAASHALILNRTVIVDGSLAPVSTSFAQPGTLLHQAVLIDTTAPTVQAISVNTTDGEYGAGQAIEFSVTFNYPVVVTGHPYLALTATNGSSSRAQAVYTHSSEDDEVLYFLYIVRPTDAASNLALYGGSIFVPNITTNETFVSYVGNQYRYHYNYTNRVAGAILRRSDHSMTPVNFSLNGFDISFQSQHAIVIDTTAPALSVSFGLQTSHSSGTYYPGEHIYLTVQFDKPVVTGGVGIYLLLDVGPRFYGTHVPSAHPSANPSADPTTAPSQVPTFSPTVAPTLEPSAEPSVMPTVAPSFVPTANPSSRLPTVYPSEQPSVRPTRRPTSMPSAAPTQAPVTFGYAYIHKLHADNVTVEFLYVVQSDANATHLDLFPGGQSLVVPNATSYILRASTHPIAAAEVDTFDVYNSPAALRYNTVLHVRSDPPVVTSTTLLSTFPVSATQLRPDDFALIQVQFNAPVVSTCSPVLVMDSTFFRDAVYVSGNGTDSYVFKYTVLIGDQSDLIRYRNTPFALCTVHGCTQRTSCQMLAVSTVPTLSVNRHFFRPVGNTAVGVSITNTVSVVPLPLSRSTTIVSVTCEQSSGEYGAGSALRFFVEFSDIVSLVDTSPAALPQLYLNIGKYAYYSGGNHGKVLEFTYITTASDVRTSSDLLPAVIPSTASALFCQVASNCKVVNQANQVAVLDTAPSVFVATGIRLDPTPPVVVSVYTNKQASPYQDRHYSVGEKIRIFVQVSKPVVVTGFDPRIEMNVTHPERFALYNASLSSPTTLAFMYTVSAGDLTVDLYYKNPYIDLYGNKSRIYRQSSIPRTLMNVALPAPFALASAGQKISVDTFVIPYVLNVTSLSSPRLLSSGGVMAAGDEVLLRVDFSTHIVATGYSYLTLRLGDVVRNALYFGYYSGGLDLTSSSAEYNITMVEPNSTSNATRHLFYRYVVEEGDLTVDLDYVDVFSLFRGLTANNDPGTIAHASSHALLPANLDLPKPSAPGSLGADGILLRVDGRVPYVTSLNILNAAGTYSTNASIIIAMNFSAPVFVEGTPSIKLETGLVDNRALYVSGSGSSTLLFRYRPEPGDFSTDLDYHAERAAFSSSAASFEYNGGRVLAYSSSPYLPASIWLNPPHGSLLGTLTDTSISGVFRFEDLHIDWRGPNYQLRYSTQVPEDDVVLSVTQEPLDVSFSSERQLRPARALAGQQVGQAVDLDGDIAVMGCPNCNVSVTTIQAVVTSAGEGAITREVELLQTSVALQPAIQSFHTTADVGSGVGGGFTISHGGSGPTAMIPYNAEYYTLEALIAFYLPSLGNVSVSRDTYIFCACDNAFTWTLTFNDIQSGVFSPITFDTSQLTGMGVGIVGPTIIQTPAFLGGTFTLSAVGLVTAPIPFDANVARLTSAIAELGIPVYDIYVSPTTVTGSRTWSITFDSYLDSYEMPNITTNGAGLTGGTSTQVFIQVTRPGRHGPYGIAGHFALSLRGNTTALLLANSTAAQVKAALEALPVINYVNVNRTNVPVLYGYTWTIEFVSVNIMTPRGLVLQETSNVEALGVVNQLIATDAVIEVLARYELGSRNQITGVARLGTYGHGAGAVHIFQRRNETWDEMATIRGNDTSENNFFGGAVAVDGDVIVVGAIGANMNGRPEKQAIHCSASNGSFIIHFRGWSTAEISHNVTRSELLDAIVSDPRVFDKLYTVTSLDIDDWGGGPLCANNTAVLTFYSPVDGHRLMFGTDTGPNLELLTLEKVNFDGGELTISEVQPGTWRLHNVNSDPQQIGAAYIFRASYMCDGDSPLCRKDKWVQEAQLFPTLAAPGSRFGSCVAISGNVAVVGAPGALKEAGTAYVFEYSPTTKRWNYLQLMTYPLVAAGDNFGSSVAIYGNTAIVGAPNYNGGTGGVFVFTRTTSGTSYTAAQSLVPTVLLYPLVVGQNFGASLSIVGNLLAVGSPGYADKTVYFGDQPSTVARTNSGAVFMFERVSAAFSFKFIQKLKASNVQEFDAFGFDLDLDGKNLVVSSLQSYAGNLTADKPIVMITTRGKYSSTPLSGSFKVKWLTEETGETFVSRFILHDASAAVVRDILMADLPTGPLLVTRSRVDAYDGGYSWSITFLDYDAPVPLFQIDSKRLLGTDARVSVEYINPSPELLRGKAHVFQRPDVPSGLFVEQMFLTPHVHQAADRCGQSVRLSGKYALVGCPNRDQRVPSQNSGAAFIYHLGLLAVQYSANYTVLEGNVAPIAVVHDSVNVFDFSEDLFFYTQTVDRNAFAQMQKYIRNLFGIPLPTKTYPDSMLDRTLLAGQAVARAQFYGSDHNESQWVDGMYDYRAISDYVPMFHSKAFLIEEFSVTDEVITTPDSILETPDEHVILGISSPGVWPSVFGRLYGQLRIYDPADGNVWRRPGYRKLYDSTSINTEGISRTSTAASIASTSSTATGSVAESKAEYGHSIAYNEALGVMVVGAPGATVNGRAKAGKAILYTRNADGNWTQNANFLSSPSPLLGGTRFGDGLALGRVYNRNISILAIGEPSLNRIHVYVSEGSNVGKTYTLETTLFCDIATSNSTVDTSGSTTATFTVSQRYGERGSIAIHGFLLVVAAPSLETVWVYRRIFNEFTNSWEWSDPVRLRSTDYDYDVIQGTQRLHPQGFGKAVAVRDRTILIGAPHADYGNLGMRNRFDRNLVETQWQSEGVSPLSYARGRAYVFYSAPASQEIRIFSTEMLYFGQFSLQYYHEGRNLTTRPVLFNSSEVDLRDALLELSTVDDVLVSRNNSITSTGFEYTWTVTFLTDWQDESGILKPQYFGHGCPHCSPFNSLVERNQSDQRTKSVSMSSRVVAERTQLEQIQELSADDKRNGDRFGSAVALDGNQIVIGAPYSATMTTTTWNFEAGHLLGWHRTGDAFNFQPTFGDNSYLRGARAGRKGSNKLRAQARSASLEGNYYIGTFEKRPGDPLNYRTANPLYPEGTVQGDGPRGTLSSDVFLVRGNKISFLIGGGCDIYVEFVELLVDGISVAKQTGQCSEKMRPVHFDVSLFINRAAQIRIVDNSTANWGHINVDNFQFDWDVAGARVPNANQKSSTGGVTETTLSGSAYVFRRVSLNDNVKNCSVGDHRLCVWTQEVKLAASDKREDIRFGAAVAVNDKAGVVLVGAPHAAFTGFYKEVPSVFPFMNGSDASTVANLHFPVNPSNMLLFQSNPRAVPERSGSYGVWNLEQKQPMHADTRAYEQAGAVYTYVKHHEKIGANGTIVRPQYWSRIEQAKMQPPDATARDVFGSTFALDGMSVAIGAPGQNGLLYDAGAVYVYSTEFTSLSFSAVEYPVLENRHDRVVTLTLLRDLNVNAGEMVVEYATSDLTARGVDEFRYEECLLMAPMERGPAGCGDYQLTSGVVVIPEGVKSGGFTVKIMDDLCKERFMEYIQVTVSVPGSAALQGERLSAKIRIDDNDYDGEQYC